VTHTLPYFKNWHEGEDIYVLGSGATLSHINPSFFAGKIVVATNRVAERIDLYDNCDWLYTHGHYHVDMFPLAHKYPQWFFAPRGDEGLDREPPADVPPNVVLYDHKVSQYEFDVDQSWPDSPNGLLVGSTSLHGSMHLAAHLGASTMILVGADCGILDGETNHGEYKSGNLVTSDSRMWLQRWEMHLRQVKRKLIEQYPHIGIYSLNPFLNLNIEGHKWEGTVS
jgi:hypothetical protein